jgi:farnesyl diphosphate synthase
MDVDAFGVVRIHWHSVFADELASLAADALQALAFEILAADPALADDPATHVTMLRVLGVACGSHGMAGGQAFDLAAVRQSLTAAELERMHVHKTGALIRASVHLGALVARVGDGPMLDALLRYAHCIGLAFQIRDDILDIEGVSEVIGKTAGKDVANAKPTYPAVLGIEASRVLLAELTNEAIVICHALGERGSDLAALARFVAERES